ncbi:MAG: Sir2 family NAD-dependent protein deacetylase, partial [Pseudomonadota bacterium]
MADWIERARAVVVFTGAGISTESGIDDFRSPGGIWSRIKPIQYRDFCSDEGARREDWRRRFHFQAHFDACEPNAGHHAIAALMARDNGRFVITQNIDGLHQRGGVDDAQIIEIHGN